MKPRLSWPLAGVQGYTKLPEPAALLQSRHTNPSQPSRSVKEELASHPIAMHDTWMHTEIFTPFNHTTLNDLSYRKSSRLFTAILINCQLVSLSEGIPALHTVRQPMAQLAALGPLLCQQHSSPVGRWSMVTGQENTSPHLHFPRFRTTASFCSSSRLIAQLRIKTCWCIIYSTRFLISRGTTLAHNLT